MNAKPLYDFMREREEIRLRKEAGQPFPWTEDPILKKFKFTNVKRRHDKTTRLLRQEFYEPHHDAPDYEILYNCAMFRYFGTIEFAQAVGWQHGGGIQPQFIIRTARERLDAGERVFTGAYVITNQGISAPKEEVVVDIFLAGLHSGCGPVLDAIKETSSWEAAIGELRKLQGFGGTGFMAKEVMLDTFFTGLWKESPWDLNSWCPAGPGARRGINLIIGGRDINDHMTEQFATQAMLNLFAQRHVYWPQTWEPLELHDIQFQLCEFCKYMKVVLGLGRPRSLYQPPEEQE